jgi:putative tryptophan/tyrosine transport system substrate-binding protein
MKKAGLSSILIAAALLAVAVIAEAQEPKKVARICFLGRSNASTEAIYVKPFRERLREIGYVEEQNFTIEYRFSEGKVDRLPDLAAELVRLSCDVIVTTGTEAAEVAKKVIKTIPVVMAFGGDAERRGIIASLAHPGGNITGLTSINTELSGKRLERLKEIIPKLSQVGYLWSPTNPDADYAMKETETVARYLRLGIQSLEVKGPDDIERVFQAATKKRAQALMLGAGGGFLSSHQKRIVELAAKNRLPGVYPNVRYVEAGGLMTYSEDRSEMLRRAAVLVDKILKGAKPADLPVEQPMKFELIINLKAAKLIGLTIPPEVLARANRLIK